MACIVSGVVREGVIVPDAPLPEGHRVEVLAPETGPADSAQERIISDRGRGPEIQGTRITVYAILDYLLAAWQPERIAAFFRLGTSQVEAAVEYIHEHTLEVLRAYVQILERAERGNPPELQAGSDARHARFRELVTKIRQLPDTDLEVRRAKVAELIRQHRQSTSQAEAHGRDHAGQ